MERNLWVLVGLDGKIVRRTWDVEKAFSEAREHGYRMVGIPEKLLKRVTKEGGK